jgi:hypothetical protein
MEGDFSHSINGKPELVSVFIHGCPEAKRLDRGLSLALECRLFLCDSEVIVDDCRFQSIQNLASLSVFLRDHFAFINAPL